MGTILITERIWIRQTILSECDQPTTRCKTVRAIIISRVNNRSNISKTYIVHYDANPICKNEQDYALQPSPICGYNIPCAIERGVGRFPNKRWILLADNNYKNRLIMNRQHLVEEILNHTYIIQSASYIQVEIRFTCVRIEIHWKRCNNNT